MLHKEVKTKKEAMKVAKQLKNDLNEEIKHFASYEIDIDERYDDGYNIRITSPQGCCNIITGCCLGNILRVYKAYELMYAGISSCLNTIMINDEYGNPRWIPMFEITISVKK